jgi:hypothetical protein
MNIPPSDPAPRERIRPTAELRGNRAARRDPGADLVPVEGGEPMPAEEPAPGARSTEF